MGPLARLQGDMSLPSLFFLKPLFPSVMATSAFLITPIKWVALLSKAWGLTQIGDEFPKSLSEPWAAHTVQMRPESCFYQKCFQCSSVCNTQLLVIDRKLLAFKALTEPIFALRANTNWLIYQPEVCQILKNFWDHLIKMSRDGS